MAKSQNRYGKRTRSTRRATPKKSVAEIVGQSPMLQRLHWQILTARETMPLRDFRNLMENIHKRLNKEVPNGRKSSVRIVEADNDVFRRLDGILNRNKRRQAHNRVNRIVRTVSKDVTAQSGHDLPIDMPEWMLRDEVIAA